MAGRLLYQTSFKAVSASAPRGLSPLSDVLEEELLAEGTGDSSLPLRPEAPVQGLELLKADLVWLADTVGQLMADSHPSSIVSFCLAFMTALASGGLVRSLLRDRPLAPSTKCEEEIGFCQRVVGLLFGRQEKP